MFFFSVSHNIWLCNLQLHLKKICICGPLIIYYLQGLNSQSRSFNPIFILYASSTSKIELPQHDFVVTIIFLLMVHGH